MHITATTVEQAQIAQQAGQRQPSDAGDPKLRKACEAFEGLLLGMVLKQGMKPGFDDGSSSDANATMRDFAVEQMARKLGEDGAFGIADLLYRQMNGNGIHAR